MRILIYKRTHIGDPDQTGWFGINDCMGQVRSYKFDAVIAVGGIDRKAKSQGISRKVNWIGVGPGKEQVPGGRGPVVGFEHFILFNERGKYLSEIAPTLANRLYSTTTRVLINLNKEEQKEATRILEMVQNEPPSTGTPPHRITHHCPRCNQRRKGESC